MMLTDAQKEEIKHRTAFIPCQTKEALALWIAEFLQLEFPDTIVDEDSTASPMGFIWSVYSKALFNIEPENNRILAYAARDSGKTLAESVLAFLMIVHLNRSVGHMAATLDQAAKATAYIGIYFGRPYFRRFLIGDNKKTKEFVRYEHADTGKSISTKEWEDLPLLEQGSYRNFSAKLEIVVCTPKGANSLHVPFFCVDEVDLANPQAYEEAKMIPTADHRTGTAAITVLTSTRKYAYGLVQNEIDKAPQSGLKIYHWNILDISRKCEEDRHHPEKPRIPVFINKEDLRVAKPAEYARLTPEDQSKYAPHDAFDGCINNCSLLAMCRGRLATVAQNPKFPQASSLQKPVTHLIGQFKSVDPQAALAQLLCRKPSQTGLIYPYLDREVHVKTPAQIAEMITGDHYPEDFDRDALIEMLKGRGTEFVAGMDFGYTHYWASPLIAIDGRRAFVIGCVARAEILTNQQIEIFQSAFGDMKPAVFADTENPQAIKEFKDAGVDMRRWQKKPGSVLQGIEVVRWMMRPLIGEPQLYFMAGDDVIDLLFLHLSQYHWTTDRLLGTPTDEPDETNDDLPDSLRYVLMNKFAKGKTTVRRSDVEATQEVDRVATVQAAHRQQIMDHVSGGDPGSIDRTGTKSVRKGRLFFGVG